MQKHYENLSLENIDGEIWKPIAEYNGAYEASNYGRIKSLARTVMFDHPKFGKCSLSYSETIMKQTTNSTEYLYVTLSDENGGSKTHRVHRLIAKAFIENSENKPFINHRDGNKTNNAIHNLEWVTVKENTIHAYQSGLIPIKKGAEHAQSKLVYQYSIHGELIAIHGSCGEAHRVTGYSSAQINKCCNKQFDYVGESVFSYEELPQEYFNRDFRPRYDKDRVVIKKDLIGQELQRYRTAKEAAAQNNIPYISIYYNLSGRTKTAYGYKWAYAE